MYFFPLRDGADCSNTTGAERQKFGLHCCGLESDLNNPVPKKGFDLMYAGKYGASAGRMGGGRAAAGRHAGDAEKGDAGDTGVSERRDSSSSSSTAKAAPSL